MIYRLAQVIGEDENPRGLAVWQMLATNAPTTIFLHTLYETPKLIANGALKQRDAATTQMVRTRSEQQTTCA